MRISRLIAGLLLLGGTLAPATETPLEMGDLKWLIRGNNVTSVDTFLEASGKHDRFRALLENATFVYDSEGPHKKAVSKSFPGVITFANNFFFAFTGDPKKQESYRSLEVIEFNPKKNEFLFHEVRFDKKGSVQFVENAASCQRCHQGKPLWPSSHLWPGAYGGYDDWIPNLASTRIPFVKFLQEQHRKGRYQYLRTPGLGSPEIVSTQQSKGIELSHKPNARIAAQIQNLNFQRITQELKAEMQGPFRYAIYGALLDCDHPQGFIAPEARGRLEKVAGTYEKVRLDTRRRMGRLFAQRARHYNRSTRQHLPIATSGNKKEALLHEDLKELEIVAKLRYFLQGQQSPMAHWSTASRPGAVAFSFFGPSGGIGALKDSLGMPLGELGVAAADPKRACPLLKKKSLASTGGETKPIAKKRPKRKYQSLGSVGP